MTEHFDQTAYERQYVRRAQRHKPTVRERFAASGNTGLWVAGGFVALLVLALAAFAFDGIVSAGRVHPGVSVGGVEVGGKNPAQATAILKRSLDPRLDQVVLVEHTEKTWQVAPSKIGATFDYDALVEDAMDVGRTGNPIAQRLKAWFGGVDLPAAAKVDQREYNKLYRQVSGKLAVPATDAKVVIDGTDVSVEPSAKGTEVVTEELKRRIEVAVGAQPQGRSIAVPFAVLEPKVTEDGAKQAADDARQMVSAPVKVTFGKKTWTFTPDDIGSWISFGTAEASSTAGSAASSSSSNASNSTATLSAVVSAEKASKAIGPKLGSIGRKPKDAKFHTSGGTVKISPSEDGLQPDLVALSSSLNAALERSGAGRTAPLKMTVLEPKLTTEKAKSMGIKTRISSYTTDYDSGNQPRVNNIHTLADSLDGALVAPGGTFSFNGQVGERTADKGYQEANAIVDGRLVPQLGGGICQVGTTIFNTIFESGLPIVERHNHSFYISHYPKGRDATVSWDGPDFKFKNDTANWVLVAAGYTDDSITISLYGTDPGYSVSAKAGDFYDVRPYPTETIKDPKLAAGAKVVEDGGEDARSVKVTRTVTKNGKVIRTDVFTSEYRAKTEIVRVGTKGAKPKAPAKKPAATKKP